MSRPAAYTDGSTYPRYVTRSHGHDTDWTEQAKCKGKSGAVDSPWFNAWFIEPNAKQRIGDVMVRGEELIKVALDICMHCPVQWDCTTWALEVEEPQGTWGLPFEDLRWLRKHYTDPAGVIARAEQLSEPVQVFVKRLRAKANSAA